MSQPAAQSAQAVVRHGRATDWPLLCTSFAYHYCKNPQSYYGYKVPPHTLITKLEQFRTSPNWTLLTACPSTDLDEVMGMLLYRSVALPRSNPAVAWLTVKPIYQQLGVATALLDSAAIKPGEVDCAFLLHNIAKAAQLKGYTLRFRPYLPDVELWNELNAGGST